MDNSEEAGRAALLSGSGRERSRRFARQPGSDRILEDFLGQGGCPRTGKRTELCLEKGRNSGTLVWFGRGLARYRSEISSSDGEADAAAATAGDF